MPKALLVFKLPEEEEEFKIAKNGSKNYCMLWDIRMYRRELFKYEQRKTIPVEEIIAKLDSLMEEYEE